MAEKPPETHFNMEEETSSQWEGIRREMHDAIDIRDHTKVEICCQTVPQLRLWLNPSTEESAMLRAVVKNAFYIFNFLLSNKCEFKDDKERECFSALNKIQKAEFQRQRMGMITKFPKSHIHYLKSRSSCQNQRNDFDREVDAMLEELDSVEVLSTILKVAATSVHLKVQFDFEKEDVQYMAGCKSMQNLGLTDPGREEVYIAAKTRSQGASREVIGTLAHELCHLALYLVYRNGGKPYLKGDADKGGRYVKMLKDIRRRMKELHPVLQLGFSYSEEEEIVVRVPHILALHGTPGEGDNILRRQAPELLDFFNQVVMRDMTTYMQNPCLGRDAEEIRRENTRLGKASRVEKLQISFDNPLRHHDLKDVPLVILTAPELLLLETLVHETVKSTHHPYLFFGLSQWDSTLQTVLADYKCDFVLLSCDDRKKLQYVLDTLSELSDIVGTRVIVLSPEADKSHIVKAAQRDSFFANRYHVTDVPEARLSNVSKMCKDRIRKNSYIRFRGRDREVRFGDVMVLECFENLVDSKTFVTLCESRFLEIGPAVNQGEGDISDYYISRELKRFAEIDVKKIRLDLENEAFAFCGCPKERVLSFLPRGITVHDGNDLTAFKKFVYLQNMDDYEILRKKISFTGKVLHLFQFHASRNAFVWRTSNGPLSHLPWTGDVPCSEKEFLSRTTEKVVVVAGEPGIGKTVLALRMLEEMEEREKKRWPLYVDLKQDVQFLDARVRADDIKQLILLCGIEKHRPEFNWLQQSVKHGSPFQIVLILDSFDEVDEQDRKYILQLVTSLSHISKIFIFSRTLCKTFLEDTIHTVAFELLPFSNECLVKFLEKYWKAKVGCDVTDEKIREAATQTIEAHMAVVESTNMPIHNPLLIRMIAEFEQDYSFNDERTEDMESPGSKRTIFGIYTRFVDYKYKIYAKEKLNIVITTRGGRRNYEESKKESEKRLSLVAASVIFGEQWQEKIMTREERGNIEELLKKVAENELGYGLTDGVRNGTPVFVHRTFAEFFAAQFLFRKIKAAENDDLKAPVLDMYGEDDYRLVMLFLDSFATVLCPLHSAIISGDVTGLSGGATDEHAHDRDEFSRNFLHVAALHGSPNVIKLLPMNVSLIRKEDMFSMTPFMYLEKFQAWQRLDAFCDMFSAVSIDWAQGIPRVSENVTKEKDLLRSVLHVAVSDDLCSLLNVLLSEFCRKRCESSLEVSSHRVDVDTIKDYKGRTLLFYALTTPVLHLLLPYCDVWIKDKYGCTPVLEAAYAVSLCNTEFDGIYEMTLREIHTQIPLESQDGPLHVMETRLVHFPVDVPTWLKRTPLHLSVDFQLADLVKLLLLRSRTNRTSGSGRTPLQMAIRRYLPDITNALISHSSIHDSPDPRRVFSRDKRWTYIRYLDWISEIEPRSDVIVSLYYSPEKRSEIVRKAADPATYQQAFDTLLLYLNVSDESNCVAVFAPPTRWEYSFAVRRLLLQFDASSYNEDGCTALHKCAEESSLYATKLLLPHADIPATDKAGRTALQVSRENHGENEVTQMLRRWTMNAGTVAVDGDAKQ